MSDRLTRIIVVGLLVLVVGVPFLLRPRDDVAAASATAAGGRLVIITPHNEQIRYEFARAFNAWRASQNLPAVEFDWRSSGGTSDLRKQVISEFERAAKDGTEEQGIGQDLFWGGGEIEHDTLAKGVTVRRDGKDVRISASVPAQVPDELFTQAFPDPDVGGAPLYHKQRNWIGVAISSFGIVYNRDALDVLQLPEPTTWADMQDGRYLRWVALADPGHSGSIAATYNAIIRRLGWTEGWAMLRRVFANARYFTASASKVPVDVSAGEAAAGMCIDFYGRFQSGAIGGNRVGYVDPVGMTMVNADPISILRGAPSLELANAFVVWLLSPAAQDLWQRKVGKGGPEKFELRRLPARRDLYTPDRMAHWTDNVDPFAVAKPFPMAMPDFYRSISPIAHAMAIDIHDDLQAAWETINEQTDPARRAEMLALFDAMPSELTLQWPDAELAKNWLVILEDDSHPRHAQVAATLKGFIDGLGKQYGGWKGDAVLTARLQWTAFFRGNYRRIVELAE